MYKLEIIDNTIGNSYQYGVYMWKYKHWWSQKKSWEFIEGHSIGKKYMCPEIYKKLKTVYDLFNTELESVKKRYEFTEVHNTTIAI